MPVDRDDPINAGVLADEFVGTCTSGLLLRRVTFLDVLTGITYEFLTNLLDGSVPLGVIAHLYKMRWNIEKTFDEVKNKLGEQKAWASSPTAKTIQAQFICMSVNLLQLIEHELNREGIVNKPELKRRAARLEVAKKRAESQNTLLPKMLVMMQQMTQHSIKLIRLVAPALAQCPLEGRLCSPSRPLRQVMNLRTWTPLPPWCDPGQTGRVAGDRRRRRSSWQNSEGVPEPRIARRFFSGWSGGLVS